MSSQSSGPTPEICCRTCGTASTVDLSGDGSGAFELVCDACGATAEGRYRADDQSIVWR
jgi:hypothetical protein